MKCTGRAGAMHATLVIAVLASLVVEPAAAFSGLARGVGSPQSIRMPRPVRRGVGVVCQAEPPAPHRADARGFRPPGLQAAAAVAALSIPLAAHAAGGDAQDSLVKGMIAGAVAGAAVDLVLYPIDTVKTRLQTNTMQTLSLKDASALYSGLVGSLAGHVPSSALFFAIYQTSKVLWLEPTLGQGAVAAQLLASALGNIGASSIRVPTEVVKTRLQSGGEDSVLACCRNVLAVDGPGGFFRGYAAFLARDLPFDAIEFVSYEQLRLMYMAALAASAGGELSGLETSLLGAVAGGLTGALTTPLDTVRARTMNEAGTGKGAPEGSLVMTAQSILAAEGVGGLFAGVVPRSLWLSLGGTVFFSSLEAVQSAL